MAIPLLQNLLLIVVSVPLLVFGQPSQPADIISPTIAPQALYSVAYTNLYAELLPTIKPQQRADFSDFFPILYRIAEAKGLNNEEITIMVRIADAESDFRQFDKGVVLRGHINPKDIGVFQIHEPAHIDRIQKLGLDIYTIEGNITYAVDLFSREGAYPWRFSGTY